MTLQKAIELTKKGFHVFPLNPNTKYPAVDEYQNMATNDAEELKKWWIDPVLGLEQPYNIGISTSRFNGSKALVVVDVDIKEDKHGDETFKKLKAEGKKFPKTIVNKTTTEGYHLIYWSDEPVKQGSHVLGKDIDIRSKGGYIVAPGSIIDGKEYVAAGENLDKVPDWIIEICGKAPKKDEKTPKNDAKIDEKYAKNRALEWLRYAPTALEGSGGDRTTFIVAAKLKDFGVTKDVCFQLMSGHWNDFCQPPWSPEELQSKIEHAYKYGQNEPGDLAPEKSFEKIKDEGEKSYLEKINDEYAIIFQTGQHTILYETEDEKGRKEARYISETSLKRKFSPFVVGQGRSARSQAEVWLDWEGRRQYNGVCFRPRKKARNGYYNTWKGFTCESIPYSKSNTKAKKGFDSFSEHVYENLCGGIEDHFNWVMGYFAHLIQKPCERPLTSLVFKGRKGTGKNAPLERIGNLLGPSQYIVSQNSRYLTSNFNGHMESCLMLVLDEAFWSGDHKADGILKGITTEKTILVEKKGKEPYTIDNLVRVIIVGNEDWLVPATVDERRYAVFNVEEGKMQQNKFFEQMRINIDKHGGNSVLLHYLDNFDLKTVDINVAPMTKGLAEQKMSSLSLDESFWFSCLKDEKIGSADWPEEIDKDFLYDSFVMSIKKRNIRTRIPEKNWFFRKLYRLSHLLKDANTGVTSSSKRHLFCLPSIEDLRNEWDEKYKMKTDWD